MKKVTYYCDACSRGAGNRDGLPAGWVSITIHGTGAELQFCGTRCLAQYLFHHDGTLLDPVPMIKK